MGVVMTQEFINRLLAAVMGKKTPDLCKSETIKTYSDDFKVHVLSIDTTWSPSSDGEATKEVRDWFAKEMPEEWEKFLHCMMDKHFKASTFQPGHMSEMLAYQLSITHLAQYIVDNYKEMFYEECPNLDKPVCTMNCDGIQCHGTGKIVKPRFAEAVKIIERYKHGT